MSVEIIVITEGATEREVGKVLYDRKIMNQVAKPRPPDWKSVFGHKREGYNQVIEALASFPLQAVGRILLIFDQEDLQSPIERANRIANDLQQHDAKWNGLIWTTHPLYQNLFKTYIEGTCIVLHVSDAAIQGISNRDFDGYILKLLLDKNNDEIATRLYSHSEEMARELLRKGREEFPELMKRNNYPWIQNKSWIYAFITAFQYQQSHVWFSQKVAKCASEESLRRVFAPLIEAWNWLLET